MSAPSAWTANIMHDLAARPPTITVHAPHTPSSHPMCAPLRRRLSRMKSTSSNRGSTSARYATPLTLTLMRTLTMDIGFL
jgi:hypothetical protein